MSWYVRRQFLSQRHLYCLVDFLGMHVATMLQKREDQKKNEVGDKTAIRK